MKIQKYIMAVSLLSLFFSFGYADSKAEDMSEAEMLEMLDSEASKAEGTLSEKEIKELEETSNKLISKVDDGKTLEQLKKEQKEANARYEKRVKEYEKKQELDAIASMLILTGGE